MTFSIVARCSHTGMLGVAITTSSIAVGARCPHARAGVGAVATQNVTDPTLGGLILDKLATGLDAESALDAATAGRPHLAYRQLTVVDRHGQTASYTGANILGIHAATPGHDCFAAGNLLANPAVPTAMTTAFADNPSAHLAERLLQGVESGLAAGGEQGDLHSAALLVVAEQPFALVDLRVDWSEQPLSALRTLWQQYQPQMHDYLLRAIDPAAAPAYGVPGDE